jgi:hypothetical protein
MLLAGVFAQWISDLRLRRAVNARHYLCGLRPRLGLSGMTIGVLHRSGDMQ